MIRPETDAMTERIRNPEMDQIVRQLNRGEVVDEPPDAFTEPPEFVTPRAGIVLT